MGVGLLSGETEIGPPMARQGTDIVVRLCITRLAIQIIEPQDHQIGKFGLCVIGKKGKPCTGRAPVQSGKQSVNSPARLIRHGFKAFTIPVDKVENRQRPLAQIFACDVMTIHPVNVVDIGPIRNCPRT